MWLQAEVQSGSYKSARITGHSSSTDRVKMNLEGVSHKSRDKEVIEDVGKLAACFFPRLSGPDASQVSLKHREEASWPAAGVHGTPQGEEHVKRGRKEAKSLEQDVLLSYEKASLPGLPLCIRYSCSFPTGHLVLFLPLPPTERVGN